MFQCLSHHLVPEKMTFFPGKGTLIRTYWPACLAAGKNDISRCWVLSHLGAVQNGVFKYVRDSDEWYCKFALTTVKSSLRGTHQNCHIIALVRSIVTYLNVHSAARIMVSVSSNQTLTNQWAKPLSGVVWAKERALGCVNSPPPPCSAARGSQEAVHAT